MKLVKREEKYKYPDGTDRPDDRIIPFLDNPFVVGFKEDRLFYSKDFDVALYKKIHDEGMTYVEAYNALGFDTKVLGENRANAAGKRVMEKARDHKLFTVDESSYDGSVPMEEMGELSPEEERAYLKARNHYLEEMLVTQKKNGVRLGGVYYILEERELKADKFRMVDSFLERQRRKENGYTATQCFKMFGVSDSGYYAWKARQLDRDGKQAAKRRERNDIKEKMRQIVIARNGVIPGKRTFRAELFRRYGLTVNVKRIAVLMKEMHLAAQRPHKDAYKHQASHNHVCAAPANEVDQDFFIGPRRVILTDITYLYYGPYRDTFYLCVFRDAYTRENLGWDIGLHMAVDLVKNAYERMLEEHGDELKHNASVYIHSDQGSQYLSTTFKELLEDDGFVQSVSARGNSQDNAPMESFFGRLKTAIRHFRIL